MMTPRLLLQQIQKALEEIRPYLQNDGGDASLLSIEGEDTVRVRFEGACVTCKMNQMIFKTSMAMTIKQYAPQIKKTINVKA